MDAHDRNGYIIRLEQALDRMGREITAAAVAQQEVAPGPLLSASQRTVLRALVSHGPCQVSEVANHLNVTLSAATGLVDRLVKAKLATRDRDQNDRRVVWVRVTPEGESAVNASETRRHVAMEQLVRKLSEAELGTLCAILEKLG